MKKYLNLVLLVFLTTAVLFAAGARSSSGTSSENITLKFLVTSAFYDLTSDLGWSVAQRVSGHTIDYENLSGTEQLMLIISAGEPYDYVTLNVANYNLLMTEGALTDITDILKQHGNNITSAITTVWPATTVNGRIFAIPCPVAQPDALQESLLFRKDMIDSAGISKATTADEFYTMLTRIKTAYPDKIPLTIGNNIGPGGYFISNLASAFGIRGLWQENNGDVVHLLKLPGLRQYMEFVVRLYREGLLDPEMPALQQTAAQNKWASSQAVVLYSNWNGIETPIGALRELQPQMAYDIMPPFKDAQGNFATESRSGVGAYGGVPITSKYPVEAIKAVNNQIELKNFTEIVLGIEGVHYRFTNGVYYPIEPAFTDQKINSNVFVQSFYREDVYPTMWEARLMKNDDLKWVFDNFKASLQGRGVHNPTSLAPAVTVIDNFAALNNYVRDTLIAITSGTRPLSELDNLVQYWNNNGGTKVEEFYNTWYKNK